MKKLTWIIPLGAITFCLTLATGCQSLVTRVQGPPPQVLGTCIDQMNMTQEINAEASKFVVYMHEFELNKPGVGLAAGGWRLNDDGEDHVKQIAAKLNSGSAFPVVVERSRTSAKPGTTYQLPLHLNEDLDAQRRAVVVAALSAMGVRDAEQRVVVAPAFAEGQTATEASRAYSNGIRGGGGGGGGGFGGGFGFGGFGFGGFGGR